MSNRIATKNAKYLSTRELARYYRLLKLKAEVITDSDLEELGELEVKADRIAEREAASAGKRIRWEE